MTGDEEDTFSEGFPAEDVLSFGVAALTGSALRAGVACLKHVAACGRC